MIRNYFCIIFLRLFQRKNRRKSLFFWPKCDFCEILAHWLIFSTEYTIGMVEGDLK